LEAFAQCVAVLAGGAVPTLRAVGVGGVLALDQLGAGAVRGCVAGGDGELDSEVKQRFVGHRAAPNIE
jgi:hypothetical protein